MKAWMKSGLSALAVAVALASASEGLLTHARPDIATGQPTICYGETANVAMGDTASPAECNALLSVRMGGYLLAVDQSLPGQPDARRAALADFCYNVGIATCERSTVFKDIAAGKVVAGCDFLLRYVYAGGRKYKGLATRRANERQLCLEGAPQ